MNKIDRAALELAIAQTLAKPDRVDQIEWKLKEDGWLATAMFASYHCQCDALNLCGEIPPCEIDDPEVALRGPNEGAWCWGARDAARLLKQMTALGISKYHPDPPAAIAAAKAARRKQ